MNKALAFAVLLLGACTVGDPTTNPGDDNPGSDPGSDPGSNPGGDQNVSGHITADQTWSGNVHVTAGVIIDAGATVTIDAGTTVDFVAGSNINVQGTLVANGTATGKISLVPASGATHFSNFALTGSLTYSFVEQHGGGLTISNGGTATITDSAMSQTSGDWLVMNGGTLNMDHSQLGIGAPTDATAGTGDTTHCNFHINSGSVTVTHSNIAGSPYGFMLYTSGATMTNNNFYGNDQDFETPESGTGDVSGSYFKAGMPSSGAGVTGTALSATPLTDAGPRG